MGKVQTKLWQKCVGLGMAAGAASGSFTHAIGLSMLGGIALGVVAYFGLVRFPHLRTTLNERFVLVLIVGVLWVGIGRSLPIENYSIATPFLLGGFVFLYDLAQSRNADRHRHD